MKTQGKFDPSLQSACPHSHIHLDRPTHVSLRRTCPALPCSFIWETLSLQGQNCQRQGPYNPCRCQRLQKTWLNTNSKFGRFPEFDVGKPQGSDPQTLSQSPGTVFKGQPGAVSSLSGVVWSAVARVGTDAVSSFVSDCFCYLGLRKTRFGRGRVMRRGRRPFCFFSSRARKVCWTRFTHSSFFPLRPSPRFSHPRWEGLICWVCFLSG